MGLDAFVTCRCWEDGLCRPPAALAARLRFDPETGGVNQTTPGGLSLEEVLVLDLEYDRWVREEACAHRNMRIASERISNWAGLRMFQDALRTLGEHRYPALLRELPDRNDGMTAAADAAACLVELDLFCAASSFGALVQLVDATNGEALCSHIGAYDGWLSSSGRDGMSCRLTADGAFQIERGAGGLEQDNSDPEVLFRSTAFTQARAGMEAFCFTDLASGKQQFYWHGFEDAQASYPASLAVRRGPDSSSQYGYCIQPLRRVFAAAVATTHPVQWV